MTDPIALIRQASTLRAVLHHDARRTRLLLSGEDRAAQLHERADRILLRAYHAEVTDPEPRA
jgi:hypothetical protein